MIMSESELQKVIDKLISKVEKMEVDVQEIRSDVRYIKEAGNKRDESLEEIDESLRGNGKPGLTSRITQVESWIESQKKFQWIVIAALVSELIGLVLLVLQHIMQ